MKKTALIVFALIFMSIPLIVSAEDTVTVRTLSVDWYILDHNGVKLQYRDFQNDPHILYLPKSYENRYYRFIESPKDSGSRQGLPILLVHMRGNEVTFIDIYTRYMKETAKVARMTAEDLENFKKSESQNRLELRFF